ncbi:perlucin-like protein [Ruditapes philippinarum]|uniref:perlucin-like protein n=1 Tax=Ruditapes philippinarum TaxID=129788 RepID=UPI00295A63EE|nr:perlucin-like protein [Ruditapes philippinarum]
MKVIGIILLFGGVWSCPNGWIRHESSCYHFSHDMEPWTGADYMCNKMGGKLVEIETAAENAVLRPIVDSMNRTYWIGLSDVQEEGVWMWMSSRTKLSTTGFVSWNKGEPNNGLGNENCVTIIHGTGGKWNDWHCIGETFYICEQEGETDGIVG